MPTRTGRRGALLLQFLSRVFVLLLLLLPAIGLFRYFQLEAAAKVQANNDRQSVKNILAVALREPIWSLDYDQINSVVMALSHVESLVSVELTGIELTGLELASTVRRYSRDASGRLTHGLHDTGTREAVLSQLTFEVEREGQAISHATLSFTDEPYAQATRKALVELMLALVVTAVFLGLLLYYLVNAYVGKPIARLRKAVIGLSEGQGFEIAEDLPDNEIRQFAEGYLELYNQLRQHQSHLQTLVEQRTRDLNHSNQKLQEEITQRIAIEEDLVRARIHAEQASQAKSQFLAHISHELRTPLNGIIGYAQLLVAKPDLPEDLREYADSIHRCGDHLLRLINNILDLSKIEANQVERKDEALSLRLLVHDIRAIVSPRAQAKSLSLSFDIAEDVPDWVLLDGEKLRQVLVNLLGNAIKFTPAGAVSLKLERAEQGRVRFSVIDTGRGIPEADQARIFDAFQQSEQVNRSVGEGGTGLGLAISRKLVAQLGGELRLTSRVGEGSCFYFDLRLPETQQRSVPVARGQVRCLSPGQHAKILVVDDVFENRHVLSLQLERVGYATALAESGEDALRQLYGFEPDLVMMDIQMPGMDGIEASRRIHKLKPELPIIAFTASVFDRQLDQGTRAEFHGILFKPVVAEDAYALIAQTLGLSYQYGDEHAPGPVSDSLQGARRDFERLPEAMRTELRAWLADGNIAHIRDYGKKLEGESEFAALGVQLYKLGKGYQLEALGRLLE
ncbi:MAG: response regulator [Gammaproteobacteria bacterium]|nr:response regulator [Gammaproteobacteria bacterium]